MRPQSIMLFPGKLETEFFGKARLVPANAFVDPLGFDLIEQCEVAIQHHAASAHIVDQVSQGHCLEAWGDRAFATIGFIHFRTSFRRSGLRSGSLFDGRSRVGVPPPVADGGGRCRAMAVPCSPMAASPLRRTSMITSWSYVSMACVQRAVPSNLARFQRRSSAVSTILATVSSALSTRLARASNMRAASVRHVPFQRAVDSLG